MAYCSVLFPKRGDISLSAIFDKERIEYPSDVLSFLKAMELASGIVQRNNDDALRNLDECFQHLEPAKKWTCNCFSSTTQLILNAMKDVAKDRLSSFRTKPWQPKQDQSEPKPTPLGTEIMQMLSSLNHHTQAVSKAKLLPWMMSMVLLSHATQGHIKMVTPVLMNASKASAKNSDTRRFAISDPSHFEIPRI